MELILWLAAALLVLVGSLFMKHGKKIGAPLLILAVVLLIVCGAFSVLRALNGWNVVYHRT